MSLGKAGATAVEVTAELLRDEGTKNILFNVIDTYIQNFKTKKAFAK